MDADARFERCLAFVLGQEGGYVDRPGDPGGPTNLGVTIPTLTKFMGHPVSVADIKALTPEAVSPLYKELYWNRIVGVLLPVGVNLATFDASVNMGPGAASRLLQRALGLTQDGLIGPRTINALNGRPIPAFLDRLAGLRLAYYQALPGWPEFGKGWTKRVQAVTEQAKAWANEPASAVA